MLKLLVISLDRLRQTLKCRESRLVDVSNQKGSKWTFKKMQECNTYKKAAGIFY